MIQKSCCKCQATTTIELSTIRNTTWCRQCFIDQINIKFFQGLKIAKEYCRPPPKRDGITMEPSSLVIHYKNDLSSFLTLQLMKNYLNINKDRSTAKWKSPIDFSSIEVVWIDLGSASTYLSCTSEIESTTEQGIVTVEEEGKIRSMVESLGFNFEIIKLDDLFDSSIPVENTSSAGGERWFVDLCDPTLPIKTMNPADLPTDATTQKPLANTLRGLTATSRRSLIENLINKSLLDFCQHKPRNKVLVKTLTSTQMAIDTLLGVSLGNGWSLDQQIGPSSYIDDVLVCRPVSQIVDAELIQFSKLLELDHSYLTISQETPSKKADIPSLITEFVTKLEENYPMTSSVINQTVNKIGKNKSTTSSTSSTTSTTTTNGNNGSLVRTCPICHLSSDREASEWKRSITLSSHEPTTEPITNGEVSATTAGQEDDEKKEDEAQETRPSLLSDQLCYACLVTFNDHQYLNHSSRSHDHHDWVQLPTYFQHIPQHSSSPPNNTQSIHSQSANHLQAVLDEFLISD
ncbi:hypothetical protein MJO28_008993 [Puccinia striiformis f. sp. tritici]|uniref:Cytoplasmic tRNA 2-thiolation protein 2 n=2 Tax=Puccinia striiformis f. sp. tritici TaxID=168172 RepID=A0A0L0V5A0_9BASI|nr:hypothetical protein Pst134EA_014989 [Puccinia striiformis f. sp. tritici]KAI9603280.1 hypothetical protein H4Q26_002598 [Puccinia striiformis f. sp. tritici PST-130]KNE94179.1 hypothetical protein PSTG_12510 [Puccinia striiformis f. sp. tritici PST-78]KAH9452155.1 hypothetical protein Pst134EB_016114 [Puccinia striiformis f. sp. tritici]KAH9462901.1 hypothetical protein Pst134EA_014989 [Puccinia striiformis f. sp. tritici]KAI7950172.1 hypothetical protein MJO28_008993 [Puccinia striiformis